MVIAKNIVRLSSTLVLISLLQACTSSVLSKRTDDQAWIEYQKELKTRNPASVVDAKTTVAHLHAILDEVPVRKILLSCSPNEGTEKCYQAKLLLSFDEAFRKSQAKSNTLSDVVYKNEQQAFFKTRSFAVVFAEVQNFHQILLSGMDLRAADHVRDLNHDCESATDAPVQSYQPFSGGASEVPKGYFSCLNAGWENDASHLLEETTERLGVEITTADAKEWIKQKQIYPVYDEVTRSILSKKAADNEQSFKSSMTELMAKMDWNLSLNAFVKKESEAIRARYPFLPVEAMLTDLYQKHQKTSSRGVASE